MADKRLEVSTVQLKGPAGSVTTDKRLVVTQANLHGSTDKRITVSQLTLVAPPPDKRIVVNLVQMVGPASTARAVYYGTASGWEAVDVYLPGPVVWQKIA